MPVRHEAAILDGDRSEVNDDTNTVSLQNENVRFEQSRNVRFSKLPAKVGHRLASELQTTVLRSWLSNVHF